MKLFGTDGVRGTANTGAMTPDILMRLAVAAGQHFKNGDHRHIVVIGKDTRLSGYMIEPALTAGFIANGMNVILVGPLPTPAISMLVGSLRADLGVMISASHNPYYDNGIKLFGPDGYKLSTELECAIENQVNEGKLSNLASSDSLGRASRLESASGRYVEFVKSTFPKNLRLDGLKIVIDCAHGAAYRVAPEVLWELGADIIPIAVDPNGTNINEKCGATYPTLMQQAVLDHGADLGIALDGDADRVVLCDEKGQLIDGDQILALIAKDWKANDFLSSNQVVGTVMSNLGLENYLKSLDLELVRTAVGDRPVGEYMRANNCNLGGEQSGHIILSDYARTGDGLVGALQVLAVIAREQKSASQVCQIFKPVPQILKNFKILGEDPLKNQSIQKTIATLQAEMGQNGRLLIRKSGTEPLLRIMAEGDKEDTLTQAINTLADELIKAQLVSAA